MYYSITLNYYIKILNNNIADSAKSHNEYCTKLSEYTSSINMGMFKSYTLLISNRVIWITSLM